MVSTFILQFTIHKNRRKGLDNNYAARYNIKIETKKGNTKGVKTVNNEQEKHNIGLTDKQSQFYTRQIAQAVALIVKSYHLPKETETALITELTEFLTDSKEGNKQE